MEDLYKKVENYSDDDEILGAYDLEWHKSEVERLVRLQKEEEGFNRGYENGMKKGIEHGIEQGLEQGLEQGIKQNNIKNALAMKSEGIDIDVISRVTGLSIDEINNL